jgi:hypothetical protein
MNGITSPPASPPAVSPSTAEAVCPCEAFVHPRTISNPPAHATIDYRVGDFLSFRHALLLSLLGEAELSNPDGPIWRPMPGDLGLQLAEWWAVCADVLTFYNQRIATQAYLRTADQLPSIQRLIRLVGYRPRPGIGAHGVLAAVTSATAPLTLPAGFPIQSKPGPGKQPQTFELNAVTFVQAPSAITADPVGTGNLAGDDGQSVLLNGLVKSLKPGDALMLLPRGWAGTDRAYQLVTVRTTAQTRDPRGRPLTLVTFDTPLTLPTGAQANDYRLVRSVQTARIWPHDTHNKPAVQANVADLDSAHRTIRVGDPVLFEAPTVPSAALSSSIVIPPPGGVSISIPILLDPPETTLVSVTSYSEAVWYVIADPNDPSKPDPSQPSTFIPVGLLRSGIGFTPPLTGNAGLWNSYKSGANIRFDWRDVGTLVATPPQSFAGTPGQLTAIGDATFPIGSYPVLVEGADGIGASAIGTVLSSAPAVMALTQLPDPAQPLVAPLTVLPVLLSVSRGKTVASEVLGSGDPRIAGQIFTLQNAPLTYLQQPDSTAGDNYSSTLTVWVDGIAWTEVASFYNQPADARIFVTREDDTGHSQVRFGDGINGARLTTGVNNVVASYRYGSGGEVPAAGTLTVLAKPWPGLRAVRNPVPMGGGADPDPPDRIRQDAPRSTLTLGRAVSLDDHAAIALAAPGVSRAMADWVFDGAEQRGTVTVWVGDDQAARKAAQAALDAAIDPNRPVRVRLAAATPVHLSATIVIDPRYVFDPVMAKVQAALIDPGTGLFSAANIGIGRSVYDGDIYAACLAVAGVQAVRDLVVTTAPCSGTTVTAAPVSTSLVAALKPGSALLAALKLNTGPLAGPKSISVPPIRVPQPATGGIRVAPTPGAEATLCAATHRHDPCAGGFFTLAAVDLDLSPVADDGTRPHA